jgi:hypothetical protein
VLLARLDEIRERRGIELPKASEEQPGSTGNSGEDAGKAGAL